MCRLYALLICSSFLVALLYDDDRNRCCGDYLDIAIASPVAAGGVAKVDTVYM